jgi:hypothetical protein
MLDGPASPSKHRRRRSSSGSTGSRTQNLDRREVTRSVELTAVRREQTSRERRESLPVGTRSSAVAAPAETAGSTRRRGRPHVGTTPPVSLAEVKQQRCPGGCVLAGPGVRRRPQALGLVGGARSISRLPGRRAAAFPKRNRHECGDRTSAFPRRQSPAADRPARVQWRRSSAPTAPAPACAWPRKGASARTGADDRFDDSCHLRRTLASQRIASSGTRALSERRGLRFGARFSRKARVGNPADALVPAAPVAYAR